MRQMPLWKTPSNIAKAIEDADGIWETETWSPIMLTAMSDTELDGREIPIAWQIEFDPSNEEFQIANESIEELGIESDGYGWGDHIRKTISKSDPALAERLHLNDWALPTNPTRRVAFRLRRRR
jgi:hypothetical protein